MMMLRGILFSAFLICLFLPLASFSQSNGTLGLDHIVLDVSSDQVTGRPLIGTARLMLMDAQNNLQYDYDLTHNPIELHTLGGSLFPSIINDQAYLDSGIIDLTQIGIRYNGQSGQVPISASSGLIVSSSVLVTFNGYDILGVEDFKGDSLTQIFSGHQTPVQVIVRNGGTLLPEGSPSLRAFFSSGGGSTRVFFSPDDSGAVDTISLNLPTNDLPVGLDTLLITLESSFSIDSNLYVTRDTIRLLETVLPATTINLVTGSIRPDSVYAGDTFPVSFDLAAAGFQGAVDSSYLRFDLVDRFGQLLTTIHDGPVTTAGVQNDVIHYSGIPAEISLTAGLLPGWYFLRMNFALVSGGSVFSLPIFQPDSVFLLPFTMPQYIPGTFAPDTVAAGSLAEFRFELAVTDSFPLQVDSAPGRATFTVTGGPDYLQTGNLIIPNHRLLPGRNTVRTDKFFIPQSQLDSQLTVSASLKFLQPRDSTFSTAFDNQMVTVKELPIAQIIRTDVVAPNAPKVDVNQPYGIVVSVANVSNTAIDNLVLRLKSDGTSIDSLIDTIPQVPANDTVDATFNIVSHDANPDELFRADIISEHHGQLQPVDNIALVQVQVPASLQLIKKLVGTVGPQNYVETGGSFILQVTLLNLGQAATTPGTYHLSSEGIDLGLPNPGTGRDTIGDITDQVAIAFQLTAPDKDTTFTLTFTLTHRPVDLNTGQPAAMQTDTAFQLVITVASTAAQLRVASTATSSVPLYRTGLSEFFRLGMSNLAQSQVNTVRVDSIRLYVVTPEGRPIAASQILDLNTAGFFSDSTLVASSHADSNEITAVFNDFVIGAGQKDTVGFKGTVTADIGEVFELRLDTSGIYAQYIDGPAQGEEVAVTAPPDGGSIVKRVYSVSGTTLAQSFMIENNPWHPEAGRARFAYKLQRPSACDFRIFTLGGELVLDRHFDENDPLGAEGSHILEWDGRNGEGKMVLDGVYVVSLTAQQTGEEARIKVAVLK